MTKVSFKPAILPALLLAIAFLSSATPATAASLDFCDASSTKQRKLPTIPEKICKGVEIQNNSSTTVTKVTVKQLAKDGCAKVKKVHSESLPGLATFGVKMLRACTYRVVYKTTKACIGNKDTTITPGDLKLNKTEVILRGGCGTLSVKLRASD